jgi:hypothetical protein
MAVTTQQSTQTANAAAGNFGLTFLNPAENVAKVRVARIDFTQSGAGDIGSTVDLCRLPPGKVRLLGDLSLIAISAFGTSRTLAIGWTAYTDDGGAAVVAATAGLNAATSVASAANLQVGTAAVLGGDQTKLFTSSGGVLLQAVVAGGTIPDGATITGYVTYAKD